jgi:hypothetical protein
MPQGMTPKERKNVKNKKSIRKVASTLAGTMGMGAGKIKDLLKEAKMRKPSGRINMDDLFNADKYKMKMPKRAPMQKGPLGPLRPIRERAKESRLVGGKSKLRKPKR